MSLDAWGDTDDPAEPEDFGPLGSDELEPLDSEPECDVDDTLLDALDEEWCEGYRFGLEDAKYESEDAEVDQSAAESLYYDEYTIRVPFGARNFTFTVNPSR